MDLTASVTAIDPLAPEMLSWRAETEAAKLPVRLLVAELDYHRVCKLAYEQTGAVMDVQAALAR